MRPSELLPLVKEVEEKHAEVGERVEELAADKAYDSADNKAKLDDEHGIKPVIDHRQLWKEEPGKPRVLFGDRVDVVLYDERGGVYRQAPAERRGADELREMAFVVMLAMALGRIRANQADLMCSLTAPVHRVA